MLKRKCIGFSEGEKWWVTKGEYGYSDREWFPEVLSFRLKVCWGVTEGSVGAQPMKEVKENPHREEWHEVEIDIRVRILPDMRDPHRQSLFCTVNAMRSREGSSMVK